MYQNLEQGEVSGEVLQVKLLEGWAYGLSHPNSSKSSLLQASI